MTRRLLPAVDWPRSLAVWQLAGGALGLIVLVTDMHAGGGLATIIVVAMFGGCALMSIGAGIAVFRASPYARTLSLWTQALQFVAFSFGEVGYYLVLGPHVNIEYVVGGSIGVHVGFVGATAIWFGSSLWRQPALSVNVLSAVLVLWLVNLPPTVRTTADRNAGDDTTPAIAQG